MNVSISILKIIFFKKNLLSLHRTWCLICLAIRWKNFSSGSDDYKGGPVRTESRSCDFSSGGHFSVVCFFFILNFFQFFFFLLSLPSPPPSFPPPYISFLSELFRSWARCVCMGSLDMASVEGKTVLQLASGPKPMLTWGKHRTYLLNSKHS